MSSQTNALQSAQQIQKGFTSMQIAFVLITSLFFMWGLSHGLLDVLNKHFQDTLHVTRAQSGLAQTAYFGAYFFVALPVGLFMERFGYRAGIQVGLALFALGALLFVPATWSGTFSPFLFALFVLACGLACLETAANLYAAAMGDPDKAAQRLTLAQSFNGLGSFMGPLIGGSLFFLPVFSIGGFEVEPVSATYVGLAVVVVLMMLVFACVKLPEMRSEEVEDNQPSPSLAGLWKKRSFTGALVAQFCAVGNYVGVGAFFINYTLDHWPSMTPQKAAYLLSLGMLGYMIGRFVGTWLMKYVAARNLLIFNASMSILICAVAVAGISQVSPVILACIYLFMSTLYPTIFAMGVRGLGTQTKKAGSFLVMAIVGGAFIPLAMGYLADVVGSAWAFAVPMVCFAVIVWYGFSQPAHHKS